MVHRFTIVSLAALLLVGSGFLCESAVLQPELVSILAREESVKHRVRCDDVIKIAENQKDIKLEGVGERSNLPGGVAGGNAVHSLCVYMRKKWHTTVGGFQSTLNGR